jgi:hypothetical protein
MRLDDELARSAGVEVFLTPRRLVELDHLDVDDLRDRQPVPQDMAVHDSTIGEDDEKFLPVIAQRIAILLQRGWCPRIAYGRRCRDIGGTSVILLRCSVSVSVQAVSAAPDQLLRMKTGAG